MPGPPVPDASPAAPVTDTREGAHWHSTEEGLDVDVLIVGAGISGIGTGIELLRRGRRSFVVLEAASDMGGTWRDNTYPGVAVDIPSISYCFSFETDYPWSRVFAPGREIMDYVRKVADKYAVTPHMRFGSRVERCEFDASSDVWSTHLSDGSVLRSRFVVSATGLLSQPKYPDIDGLDSFAGEMMHSARWNHDFTTEGKRVAVIGTGASAVQIVPALAREVGALEVYQRTPIWVADKPDGKLDYSSPFAPRRFAVVRKLLRAISEGSLEIGTWAIVNYKRIDWVFKRIESELRRRMMRRIKDPAVADKMVPNYGLGCKRPAFSNHYLQSFNRDNVTLVAEGIDSICAEGIVTRDGVLHELDAIVLSTGFLTTERGASPSFEVFGRDGLELGQYWEDERLQAYAGVSVPGFPNFFLTSGPYSGGFNWFAMLEAHLLHIMQCIEGASARHVTRVEVERETHDRYMKNMWESTEGAVFKVDACLSANSYYLDRHGDASLPFPRTPLWRWFRVRRKGVEGYHFGA